MRCIAVWKLQSISLPKADDVVQRYGAQRLYYPLGRCIAANGEKGGDGFGADEKLGCGLESG